jgi:hypothetical protein
MRIVSLPEIPVRSIWVVNESPGLGVYYLNDDNRVCHTTNAVVVTVLNICGSFVDCLFGDGVRGRIPSMYWTLRKKMNPTDWGVERVV